MYLLARTSSPVRFSVTNGHFTEDTSWQPTAVTNDGQQPGGSLIAMNEWIVGATNSVPAKGHLTMFAVHQGDATNYHSIQPYKDDPVPPGLAFAFGTAAPKSLQCTPAGDPNGTPPSDTTTLPGDPAVSWAGMSLIADPENGLYYGVETLTRKVAAFRISHSGHIQTVWKETQTTSEWPTLIGPRQHRVWVGTDIPITQIPGANANDAVVWRDARTGRELARSRILPTNITQGSAVQPGYDGNIYFPGLEGMLIRLRPIPDPLGKGHGPNKP